MAINSSISIGEGIGLQGKPEMYEDIAVEQLRYKRKKQEEEKVRNKEILDRFRGALNVTGYDPIYNTQIATSAAKVMDQLNKAQSGKYLNTIESNPEFRKAMSDFQITAGNAKTMTGVIAQAEKEASDVANVGKINVNTGTFDALNKARIQGDVTPELAQLFGGNAMGIDRNKFYTVIPPKPVDYIAKFQEKVTPTGSTSKTTIEGGEKITSSGKTSFDKELNAQQVNTILDNPNNEIGVAAMSRWMQATNGDAVKARGLAYNELYNDLKSRFQAKTEYSEKKPAAGFSFGNGRAESDKTRVFYSKGETGEVMDFQNIDPTENKNLTFTSANGETISGIPKRYQRKGPGSPWMLVVSVPQYEYKGVPDANLNIVNQKVETGKFVQREVPYDRASSVIEGEYGFNPFQIMEGLAPEKGKEVTRTSHGETSAKQTASTGEKTKVKVSGVPSATVQQWLSAGWTQDAINKAVQQGKIKVL